MDPKQGQQFEDNFHTAACNLKELLRTTGAEVQILSVRKATDREEAEKKDQFVILGLGGMIYTIPIQLTISRNGKPLKEKQKLAKSGQFTLISPGTVNRSPHQLFELVERAAKGDIKSLRKFRKFLEPLCRRYIRRLQKGSNGHTQG